VAGPPLLAQQTFAQALGPLQAPNGPVKGPVGSPICIFSASNVFTAPTPTTQ
ncbi:MAG: hypothetical protein JO092_03650, partial [Candidatus Eremiobacteraeota bacterium]|nr:hypothetical protein [Candidatus Eremiobacteraeota bacterium]